MPRGYIIPVEDTDYNTLLSRLTQEWRDLTPRRRSEMIMDAYIAARGRPYALNVTF